MTVTDRQRIFGPLTYELAPTTDNPENIIITNDFAHKIVIVNVPWSNDGLKRKNIQIHEKIAEALQFCFEELRQKQLLHLLLTFDGSYCPRLIRGGKDLSNHAFGTALDFNAKWNPLGAMPAEEGQKGSLVLLVPIFRKHGFSWGGDYKKRKDGMHFEYCQEI